ncbi:MAG: response regulator [Deltaproteobacteria bacterium]|jgi:PAS domain S-box-containing protein|nr:response regulator [Deltaproteobacteria bacterium]MBT4264903.1 response regulator [Deltaproteobacteria bacterium]MBT4639512.1 response regulator [Deltaproteobacteria bacterium]MBT5539862.1 response regulator [Candidatus Neomarinimicrobiota bacterium]MBT7888937.1 response regulator [Deltaproteobacteria bacterium]
MEKASILIVEDEAIIAMELESQLQSLGYEVTSIVNTGEKAIENAEADKPDLMLMDIRIKGEMDGIEAAEVIRNRFGIPVIFSTAYLDEERIERAKITMPFGYVLKPIQERDLRVTLEMALYVAKVDKERKKVEEELRVEKEKYKVAYYTSPDAVNINRMDSLYVDINEGFTRLTGFTREDAIGKLSSEIDIWAIPEDRERLVEGLNISSYVENLESKFKCKDGSFKTALMSASIFEIDGEPHILSVTRDITARKKTEEELQVSQLTFSQQFYQSSTSMCLYNPDGTIEKANPKFCEMFGVEEETVKEQYDIFKDQAIIDSGVLPKLEKLFKEKKIVNWNVTFNIDLASSSTNTRTTESGTLKLEVYGYPILDQRGELLYVVLQHYNIPK